jgi:hypothetical protein
MAVEIDRGSRGVLNRVDNGCNVLEFARDSVLRSIGAGAAAPTINRVDSDMRLQVRQERAPARVVGGRTMHNDKRRTLAARPDAGVESVGDDAVVEASSCGDPRADPLADPPAPPRDHAKEESFPTTNEPACVNIVQNAKRREVRSDKRDVFSG